MKYQKGDNVFVVVNCEGVSGVILDVISSPNTIPRYFINVEKYGICQMSEKEIIEKRNHQPKFKVGDYVKINPEKVVESGNRKRFYYSGEIIHIDKNNDCLVIVQTITFPEGIQYWFSEEDLTLVDKYITESKPKWSVGTYVEFLEKYYGLSGIIVNKGLYEIEDVQCSTITINNDDGRIVFFESSLNEFCKNNKVKWHENKPEEKIKYTPTTPEFYDGSRLNKYYADEPVKMARYDDKLLGKGVWSTYMDGFPVEFYSLQWFKNMQLPKILRKPEIIISKQKQIKLNINKPKI